jgi:hypothetical protein
MNKSNTLFACYCCLGIGLVAGIAVGVHITENARNQALSFRPKFKQKDPEK